MEINFDGFPKQDPPPAPASTDKDSVVTFLRRLLRRSLYEDSDFEVTQKYIKVDLLYDSKSYVKFYIDEVLKKYPNNTTINGTSVTIHFGETLP